VALQSGHNARFKAFDFVRAEVSAGNIAEHGVKWRAAGRDEIMKNPFKALKDKALGVGVKALINREIKEFGAVSDLKIDTGEKTIRVELELKGDGSPVVINVGSYELTEKNGKIFIEARELTASREWIAAVLNKYAVGQSFELPDAARMLL
jgi:hypothetical protein